MNLFRNILGAPAARRYRAFLFMFPHAEPQSRRGREELSIQNLVNVLGAPHSDAGNSRSVRKEQASCLRSQGLYRRAAGAPKESSLLCASVPLREVLKKFQEKICENLRINKLLPQSKTEFTSWI